MLHATSPRRFASGTARRWIRGLATCVFYGVLIGHAEPRIDPSCYGSTIRRGVVCPGEQTDAQSALHAPSAYAWTLFAEVNQPAFPGRSRDTRRLWETWKNADDDADADDAVYLADGHAPEAWDVKPRRSSSAKNLKPIRQLRLLHGLQELADSIDDQNADVVPSGVGDAPPLQEVRMNRPAFNFIREKRLYNREGQYAFASTYPMFDFPAPSKEVKAVWIEATGDFDLADYYHHSEGGKTYVLVAMHVMAKAVSLWHWSSFVHKDHNADPVTGYAAPLAREQRVPESLRGTAFANFRLIGELVEDPDGTLAPDGSGAQVDWATSAGAPTIVGNPRIEVGFERHSSCITCHARASIGRRSDNSIVFNTTAMDVGAVDMASFSIDGVVFYPLDFFWSLSRAHNFQP